MDRKWGRQKGRGGAVETGDKIAERIAEKDDALWKSDKVLRVSVERAKGSLGAHVIVDRLKLLEQLEGSEPLATARLAAGVEREHFHDLMAEAVAEFICLRSELRRIAGSKDRKHMRAVQKLAALETDKPLTRQLTADAKTFLSLHDAQDQFGGVGSIEQRAFDALLLALVGLHDLLVETSDRYEERWRFVTDLMHEAGIRRPVPDAAALERHLYRDGGFKTAELVACLHLFTNPGLKQFAPDFSTLLGELGGVPIIQIGITAHLRETMGELWEETLHASGGKLPVPTFYRGFFANVRPAFSMEPRGKMFPLAQIIPRLNQ